MDIEKEVRFNVSEASWRKVIEHTEPLKGTQKMVDITLGAYGFDSLAETDKIFRVRQIGDVITIEIKHRTEENSWLEQAIKLENIKQGLNFLMLAGLDPYLFIDRTREVRKYKNLKIFMDDIDLLGKYVEIEYQDSTEAEAEITEFLALAEITSSAQPLYGDIFKQRIQTDPEFKAELEFRLNKVLYSEETAGEDKQ